MFIYVIMSRIKFMIFPINLHGFLSDYHYPYLGAMVIFLLFFKNVKKNICIRFKNLNRKYVVDTL
jgi:hypothetical protein